MAAIPVVACGDDAGRSEAASGGGAGSNAGAAANSGSSGMSSASGQGSTSAAGTGSGGVPGVGGSPGGGRSSDGASSQGGTPSGGAGRAGATSQDAGRGGAGRGGASSGNARAGGDANDGGEPSAPNAGTGGSSELGPFGIKQLYPPAPSGAAWTSEHWAKGKAYSITGRTDGNDPLGISGMRGDGTLQVTGTGELVMGGSQPRIYVYPPDEGPWRDVEVTVYYERVEDAATAYAGLVVGVRSGDGHNDDTACDAHTYYARLRHDGAIDFEKELKHPASSTRQRIAPSTVWPPDGQLPFDTWIGWKFVVYNLSSGSVKLESYRDLTQGKDGGDWKLINETVDDGGWSVEDDCPAHAPSGGESDMVVVDGGTTFIRNTDVTEARYRWFTIREIDPP